MRTKLRSKFTLFFIVCAALLAFAGSAMALTTDPSGSTAPAPTIQSDKADYAPGELVTLTGSGWQSDELVNIRVNDDAGQTWSRNVDVNADASGNISDSFNLPSHFVATYSVTASGASGTATTSFTDANVRASLDGITGPVSMSWAKFNGNAACTGTPNTTNSENVSSSGFTNLTGVDSGQSLRVTAPSPVGNFKFTSWSGATSSTANPVCVPGSSSVQSITANYSRITSTALQSNDNTTTYGDNVTFTATVTAAAGNPNGNGTVDFKDGSTVITGCEDVALIGNTAQCQITSLGAGDHTITAEYSGTTGAAPRWAASTSSALTQTVSKATTNTTVTCEDGPFTYNGLAHEPCSARVTGAGGLDESVNVTYQNNVNAGQATANATYAESANHLGSSGSENFEIARANITVTADAKSKVQYQADPPLTYQVTGKPANGVAVSGALTRAAGETPGQYAILQGTVDNTTNTNYNITYVGANLTITPAYSASFLQPINGGLTPAISGMSAADAASAFSNDDSRFKLGSTVPVKFQLKDASGAPVTNAGDIRLFVMQADNKPDPGVAETISTSAATDGNLFRLVDATTGTYMFNLSTKSGYLNPGAATPTAFTSQGTYKLSAVVVQSGTSYSVNIQLVK